jgi:hypothetical protein
MTGCGVPVHKPHTTYERYTMNRYRIAEEYPDLDLLLLEPSYFDKAIVGVVQRCNSVQAICYDANKCIKLLEKYEGMSEEDAGEYFVYNTQGAFVGEHTPVFLYK